MGGHKVASESLSRIFFLNNANKVFFWNFHLVLTKDMGEIHQVMQSCIKK